MLFMCVTVLKMADIRIIVCLQRQQKFSETLRPMGEKCLKRNLIYVYCILCNEIKICHSGIKKACFFKKMVSKIQKLCILAHTQILQCIPQTGENV